jgi:hypothetical protein
VNIASSTTHGKTHTLEYRLFHHARERALAKGLPFAITLDDVVIPDVCPVLGIPLVVVPTDVVVSRAA